MASAPSIAAPGANGITDQSCNGNNAGVSALQRINSYLHNTLDLRAALSTHPTTNGNNSIDSLWSDLVSGNTDANRQQQPSFSRAKSHSVNGNNVDMQSLSQLLNGNSGGGGNGYQNYSNGRCTPRATQSGNSTSNGANIFNYTVPAPPQTKDDSTSSNGSSGVAVIAGVNGASPPSSGTSPITSPSSHFSYASPSKANRMNNVSDPGSPSLDDAIMMGIQRQRNNNNNTTDYNSSNNDGVTLAHLMGSLNMNNCSGSRSLNCSGQLGASDLPNLSGLNSTFNSSNNYMHQGLDFSHLAPYQGNTSNSSWRGAPQNRGYDPNMSGSLGNNSYNTSNYHNGSSLLGSSLLSSNNSTLDMLSALERGAPLSSFLTAQDPFSIEKAAKMHRTAAAVCEATCTWSGQLPVRIHKNPFYSMKVFLGGVPWDVTEPALRQTFMHFGNIQVEWPGKENSANPPKGYVYILFDNEKQVKNLLAACSQDFSNGGSYYFKMSSRRMRQKEVQVIPWVMSDSNYVRCPSYQLDAHKTVFIGALHGMLSAEALANIMNDLFSGVVYAGIDTDKHKYPIGSGRITFNNLQSYRKAVRAAFVEIKTPKFTKKVQIDPYLADSLCQICGMQQGPYFCRDETCFKYFCRTCWLVTPNHQGTTQCHKPLMRNSKLRTQTRLTGGLM